jgi:hypothetical protein
MLTNMTRVSPVRVIISSNYPGPERSGFEMQPQRLSALNDTMEVENTAATRCTCPWGDRARDRRVPQDRADGTEPPGEADKKMVFDLSSLPQLHVINLCDLGDPPSKHRRPSAHNPHLGTHDRDHQQHHVQVEADVQRDRRRADGRGTCPEARRATI